MDLHFPAKSLPVLRSCDVLISGGSLAGIAAALALAKTGRRVQVVEPRTYLGRELTATLRPWLEPDKPYPIPAWMAALVTAAGTTRAHETEIPLKLDVLKIGLEDLLLQAGVDLLYGSYPVQVLVAGGRGTGVVIGNKSGRQVIRCGLLLDASETAVLARLAGAAFEPEAGEQVIMRRTLEFAGLPFAGRHIQLPAQAGLVGDSLRVHAGAGGDDHKLVEMALAFPLQPHSYATFVQRELEARRRSLDLALYLKQSLPAFFESTLAGSANELHGRKTERMLPDVPARALETVGQVLALPRSAGSPPGPMPGAEPPPVGISQPAQASELPVDAFAGPVAGLWCLNAAACLAPRHGELFDDPLAAAWLGQSLGEWLAANQPAGAAIAQSGSIRVHSAPWHETPAAEIQPAAGIQPASTLPASQDRPAEADGQDTAGPLQVCEQESPQAGRAYPRQPVPASPIPLTARADVLVAGGGTSGAVAALASAREGAATVLLEMNPALGGTGTLGGVLEYWFGRRVGFSQEIEQRVLDLDHRLGYVAPDRWHQWSPEGKLNAQLQLVQSAGAHVRFYAMCIATLVYTGLPFESLDENAGEGSRQVGGVVAATPYGPLAFLASVVVDATGDGDIAAFAGADFVYGAQRDASVMWSSLPQFGSPGLTMSGNFTSMCDVSNVEDFTRAILANRRRRAGVHDHGIYLAPRESRHILAEVVLSYTDMLLHRRWPDVINIFYSNYDIKGKSSTDWNLAGLISANLEVELPYRVLLPHGLEGILVSGKAFSAGSDATPLARMQADLENLGGVTGLAAAMAARAGRQPRDLPVHALQQRLVEMGVLPAGRLARTLQPRRLSTAQLRQWIERLDAAEPLYAINNRPEEEVYTQRIPFVEVCTAGPQAIPLLGQALEEAHGDRQVLIAQALAMCGDPSGAPLLAAEILRLLGERGLPARTAHIQNVVRHLPDHAAMPDVVYLLYSLGMAHDSCALAVWAEVAERLDFSDEDFRDGLKAPFYYVDALCYGAERLGDPRAVPMLLRLHSHPLLHDQVSRHGAQPDYMLERLATLELVIGRALARCGNPLGVQILTGYLDDARSLLAEHAHRELARISGHDFGKDASAWQAWLVGQGGRLSPAAWRAPTDAQRAWAEQILVDESED